MPDLYKAKIVRYIVFTEKTIAWLSVIRWRQPNCKILRHKPRRPDQQGLEADDQEIGPGVTKSNAPAGDARPCKSSNRKALPNSEPRRCWRCRNPSCLPC